MKRLKRVPISRLPEEKQYAAKQWALFQKVIKGKPRKGWRELLLDPRLKSVLENLKRTDPLLADALHWRALLDLHKNSEEYYKKQVKEAKHLAQKQHFRQSLTATRQQISIADKSLAERERRMIASEKKRWQRLKIFK